MRTQLVLAYVATGGISLLIIFIIRYLLRTTNQQVKAAADHEILSTVSVTPDNAALFGRLPTAIPESMVPNNDVNAFRKSKNLYWAQQESEVVPACVIQARCITELSTAMSIIKSEYDRRQRRGDKEHDAGLFAVRGGGHSPIAGAATIHGGIMIDLSLFREVRLSRMIRRMWRLTEAQNGWMYQEY
ncbi:hypothetical protein MMC25_004902 [Agyrium rufum]|nr:hypothetical protein [Agyrium rufum]